MKEEQKIVIVGGGFGGIRLALDLSRKLAPNMKITLISNKHHFEYYPRIYRAVTGESPLEICIPLDDIFLNKNVEIVVDEIQSIDPASMACVGSSGSVYKYNDLVITIGSETAYFGIEGVQERAFGFKSIHEALKLKNHLHKMFEKYSGADKDEMVSGLNVVVVGGGPTGVEFCGELIGYLKKIVAKNHNIDRSFVTVELIEASSRLLPTLPKRVSSRVYKRLHSLGVNIFLNRTVVKEEIAEALTKDMSFKSRTLVWTAGSRPHKLYSSIPGITLHKNGKVIVDEHLQAVGVPHVYVAGDGAQTLYSGMAQTAIYDGVYLAKTLAKIYQGKQPPTYKPKKVAYAVPVGPHWAAVSVGPLQVFGFLGWVLRQIVDFKFLISILPFSKAMIAFRSKSHLCESCPTCNELIKENSITFPF